MRYRHLSKIKRKHHCIDTLDSFLQTLEKWPAISAINPGVITPCRHNDRLKFTVQYQAENGVRCLARAHGAVQEVFLVSSTPITLCNELTQYLAQKEEVVGSR